MRRLNVKLAVWLVGITLVSVVGVHFLHGFQLERNANFLKVQAETARTNKKVEEAVKQYNQYLKYRDDPEGYAALAELVVGVAGDADATRQQKWRAYTILEEAIRRHPDLTAVRRQLIDYTMQMRRFSDALDHIKYLSDSGTKDSGLELKVATCYVGNGEEDKALRKLCELIGYDEAADQFAQEPPAGASEVGAFELLSHILMRKDDNRKRADTVMTQMVTWNPDSAKAHLTRANFMAAGQKPDSPEFATAKLELERAFELAPHDADVMLTAAGYAMAQGEYPKSQELLNEALKEFPERQDVYLRLSQLALAQCNPKLAIEQLQSGLKKAAEAQVILERLVDLQFQANDLDAVRETLKLMEERPFTSEFLRYQHARLTCAEGNFSEAARELANVRPAIARFSRSNYVTQLDVLLGRCYEALGQPDSQLEVYRRLVQAFPDMIAARLGHASALQSLGRFDDSAVDLEFLTHNAKQFPMIQGTVLQMLIQDQMRKPEDQRDWKNVEAIADLLYADEARPEFEKTMLKADLLIMQGKLEAAQKALTAASKQFPKEVRLWTTLARLLVRMDKTSMITQLLKRAEKEVGDVVPLRVERIRMVLRQGGNNASEDLQKLELGTRRVYGCPAHVVDAAAWQCLLATARFRQRQALLELCHRTGANERQSATVDV